MMSNLVGTNPSLNGVIPNKPLVTNPEDLVSYYKKVYPKMSLHLHFTNSGFVILETIFIPKNDRGQGLGQTVMQDIVDSADENNWNLGLTPDSVFGTPKPRLETFYRRFGFFKNLGVKKDFATSAEMIRYPQ